MKVLSLLSVFYLCFNVNLIYGGGLDGQYSCAFGKTRSKRWISPTELLAKSTASKKDVKFFLYNKEKNDRDLNPLEIFPDNAYSLKNGNFDPRKLTKIIIHGYRSDKNGTAARLIRKGFFKNGDFNVLIVDWSTVQHTLRFLSAYDSVVKKLESVGKHVSNVLRFLENYGLDLSTTTIVGHSLGAHVAGIASNKLGSKIGRIVGLDPAGPLMSTGNDDRRLSKDDAIQVEVIHSEIEQCGLKKQMGHYDFYPNSGLDQPGCDTYHCSHARSYNYFAESLDPRSRGFYGRLCDDWWSMHGKCDGKVLLMGGLNTKLAEHGIYYVKTNGEPPYAQGRL